MTEEEVVEIIDRVAKRLANKFKFSYHETKDMEQEARLLALEGLEKYDQIRPLENYLWTHVHNRLFNFKRDNYIRPYRPCMKCEFGSFNTESVEYEECSKYNEHEECKSFKRWLKQNNAKLNIAHPLEYSCVDGDENGLSYNILAEDDLISNELKVILDKYIPIEYRHHYLRLIHGYRVVAKYKKPLLEIIQDIIDNHYKDNKESNQENSGGK